jgi:arylsulfatase A-like enzyme
MERRDSGSAVRRAARRPRGVLRWLGWGVVGAVAVAGLWVAARIALYRQTDDAQHVATKRAYLERIAESTGGKAAGPNVVLILFDDLGYGDIGAYGGRAIRTPNLDGLAGEGARFANAYSAGPYCSAARAGLLTGRYPVRAGLDHVLQAPGTWQDQLLKLGGLNRRLPAEEITIAEVLSAAGYATAHVGKWHLGGRSPSLPRDMGFDSFYGLLYSNDQGRPELLDGDTVVEPHPVDQRTLTRRYTERAVAFIEQNRERPFFLYLAHTFPHTPLHVAPERLGRSDAGLYGDVVQELDESVGRVLDALDERGLADRTLVLVSSDNGPWFQGSPGVLRGRKFDVFEGGTRVPLIARWRGRFPPGKVVPEPVGGIAVFPTLLELAGLPLPDDRIIDGQSLVPLLEGDAAPRGPIYYHQIATLRAVRLGRFKYHDRHGVFFGNPMDWPWGPMKRRGPWLFDLDLDPAESYDVSHRYPETARQLRSVLDRRREELERNPRGWMGKSGLLE